MAAPGNQYWDLLGICLLRKGAKNEFAVLNRLHRDIGKCEHTVGRSGKFSRSGMIPRWWEWGITF
jgi:hypothetical protein